MTNQEIGLLVNQNDKMLEAKNLLIQLLASRNCYHDGMVETAEEMSAQFDIGLDVAHQIVAFFK